MSQPSAPLRSPVRPPPRTSRSSAMDRLNAHFSPRPKRSAMKPATMWISRSVSRPVIHKRISEGERGDLVIIQPAFIGELVKAGKVVAGDHPTVASVGVGLMVRADANAPDVASVEAFKRALQAADTIVFNNVASGNAFAQVLDRVGLAELAEKQDCAGAPHRSHRAYLARRRQRYRRRSSAGDHRGQAVQAGRSAAGGIAKPHPLCRRAHDPMWVSPRRPRRSSSFCIAEDESRICRSRHHLGSA